jgi:hypothetical protein
VPLLVAALAVIAAVVIIAVVSGRSDTGSASTVVGATTAAPRYFACVGVNDDRGDDHCARQAKDYARRTPLASDQQAHGEAVASDVERAVEGVASHADETNVTCPNSGGPCAIPMPTAARPGDVDLVRTALDQAGMTGAVVRIASADDPAPRGSLMYAVPAGPACVLGYTLGLTGGGGHSVVGHLPDGTCLSA